VLIFTFLAVQFGAIPVHVVFLVEHFEDLVFSEGQLVVGRGVEVVLGDGLHRVVVANGTGDRDDDGLCERTPSGGGSRSSRDLLRRRSR
jgi:hypothetical protein